MWRALAVGGAASRRGDLLVLKLFAAAFFCESQENDGETLIQLEWALE